MTARSLPLCIYHGNCQDGFAAAWCVRRAFGPGVEFVAGVYQDPPPDVAGRDVIIVDFSYKRPVLEAMAATAQSILILDHHRSAMEELAGLPAASPLMPESGLGVLFDLERSGAGLAWDYFCHEKRPPLIDHIEDYDLWRFRLSRTREVCAALFSYPYDFALWDELMRPKLLAQLIDDGAAIERKHRQDITNLLPVVRREMVIGGIRMPVANLPTTLTSDAGNQMASEAGGIAACYWDTPAGRVFSLRSVAGGPDCQMIAVLYGGGGHVHAAGFRVPLGWEGDG
jgi:hypothetical protein